MYRYVIIVYYLLLTTYYETSLNNNNLIINTNLVQILVIFQTVLKSRWIDSRIEIWNLIVYWFDVHSVSSGA